MRKLSFLLASATLVAGCSHEQALAPLPQAEEQSVLTVDEAKFLVEAQMPVKLSPEEIDRIALDAAGFLDEVSPSTRSAVRSVSKITPISGYVGNATRTDDGAEEADSAEEFFYAVDFAEGEGYALISADRRLPDEVLVNVGSGSFPEGEIENPGFALMMEGAENYARREIARYEARHDSIEIAMLTRLAEEDPELAESIEEYLASIGDGGSRPETRVKAPIIYELVLVDTRYEYGPWTTTQQIAPMIPVEWDQGAPFNDFVEAGYDPAYLQSIHDNNGDYIPAGCVAIAVAQLMAYWEYPETLLGTTMDWGELQKWSGNDSDYSNGYKTWSGRMSSLSSVDLTRKMCNKLISWIGIQTDMDYGRASEGGSGTTGEKAMKLLNRLGYATPSERDYNLGQTLNSLNAGHPVFMRGFSSRKKFLGITITHEGGHAWLIDGYLKQQQEVTTTYTWGYGGTVRPNTRATSSLTYETTETAVRYREFFHNNFGWGGVDNGYYAEGVFNTGEGYGADLPSDTRAGDGNFVYKLEIWPDIRR